MNGEQTKTKGAREQEIRTFDVVETVRQAHLLQLFEFRQLPYVAFNSLFVAHAAFALDEDHFQFWRTLHGSEK